VTAAKDEVWMARAVELATARMGRTWPNPAVGCVIVRDDRVIAEAATADGGRPHAEEQAVPAAGEAARGATAYVTMEPCGGRSSGVTRVVVAAVDPSPFAAGRGIEKLRAAGLEVETGVLADRAAVLYEGYLHRVETGRPLVRLSEDGEGFDARFAASPKADLTTELKRLGEAGYTRVWVGPGELADALSEQGLLTV
jgi:diaminohydroxyphosphoribosylaminopyrimidine deaminase / 5-amino-6-(5-phosphoribosylamino)uracil reductase